jgi:hypothetical protein
MGFRVTTWISYGLLVLFMFMLVLQMDGIVQFPCSFVLVPLWIVLLFVVRGMLQTIETKGVNSWKASGSDYLFVLIVIVALGSTLIMSHVNLCAKADCEDQHEEIDLDDLSMVDGFCACNQADIVSLFNYSTCYWDSQGAIPLAGREDGIAAACGDRVISDEQIRADFLSKSFCGLNKTDSRTGRRVTIVIGDKCTRLIPIWVVFAPIFILVVCALYNKNFGYIFALGWYKNHERDVILSDTDFSDVGMGGPPATTTDEDLDMSGYKTQQEEFKDLESNPEQIQHADMYEGNEYVIETEAPPQFSESPSATPISIASADPAH